MFGAHMLGHVLDLSSGMCSRLMLGDVFRARVVGRVPGPCCRTCSAPMLLDLHRFDYLKKKGPSHAGWPCIIGAHKRIKNKSSIKNKKVLRNNLHLQ